MKQSWYTFGNHFSMRDPRDEDYFQSGLEVRMLVEPHRPGDPAWRCCSAQESTWPATLSELSAGGKSDAFTNPVMASLVTVEEDACIAVTALYRESGYTVIGFEGHLRQLLLDRVLLRLAELNDEPALERLSFCGAGFRAFTCSSVGEVLEAIFVDEGWLIVDLLTRQIATIAVELASAPGEDQKLDEFRGTWAAVHRGVE